MTTARWAKGEIMRLINADKYCDFLNNYPLKKAQDNFMNFYRDALQYTFECEVDAEPVEFEWCHDCKEYDQNAHCCHRWTKVIRNTVNDLKTQGYEPVRHGHWEVWFENEETRMLKCSECRMMFTVGKGRDGNYCPNCGARMMVKRNETD